MRLYDVLYHSYVVMIQIMAAILQFRDDDCCSVSDR